MSSDEHTETGTGWPRPAGPERPAGPAGEPDPRPGAPDADGLSGLSGEPVSALSWVLGVGSLAACVGLALAWASWQFRREAVLFRGEEGLSLRAWWRTLTERE